MTIHFSINYRTAWGESLYVRFLTPEAEEHEMSLTGDSDWSLDLVTDAAAITYTYVVKRGENVVRSEWGAPHSFEAGKTASHYTLIDRWQDQPWNKPFYSQAFTDCINHRKSRSKVLILRAAYAMIEVEAPMVATGQELVICGGCPALGDWNPAVAPAMNDSCFPRWTANLDLKSLPAGVEYKFVVVDKKTREVIAWEAGRNRSLSLPALPPRGAIRISGLRFENSGALWRGAGVAIPVFSLRTNDDFGVGDFYDLKKMVDWAVATGQRFIQILPINDTTMTGTWTDSYPYNANSTFALHPMYLRLEELGTIPDPARRDYYAQLKRELNAIEVIDYEKVNNAKISYTREIFAEKGAEVLSSDDFAAFIEANVGWLKPYAAFCVLRDMYGTPEFERWEEFAVYDADRVDRFIAEHIDSINFVYYQQYNLDRQLRHVRDYAHEHGVAIKGDIPIGISRTSVDAWISPRLFNLDCQAGAPPDDFSVLGQNWGFPTYNWEEMARDSFAWWKARFRKMAEYFDAYRIDHVLGFFRIWQIPMDAIHGLLGIFNPALPLTAAEMQSLYDFHFDADRFTRPLIADWFLGNIFTDLTDEARARFLVSDGDGHYHLRPEFDTQRKVADYFAAQEKDDKNTRLCNALMSLIDDVLFIEDPYEKGHYHPRISGHDTWQYRSLNDYQRWCFDRLYNDFFYHRHDDFWYHKAMWKLPPLIDATSMLTCAEDLGMIPHCVPAVMHDLEILTLDIQRMPKDPHVRFGNPAHYPYYTVCTTSTHDMGGIRQWWEEDRAATQDFYNHMLHEGGAAPYFAEPWICEKIVVQHLKSPAMLCILPLQDWLSIDGTLRRVNPYDEQINVPANSRHYWRYRMHLTIEDLIEHTLFNKRIRELVTDSGR